MNRVTYFWTELYDTNPSSNSVIDCCYRHEKHTSILALFTWNTQNKTDMNMGFKHGCYFLFYFVVLLHFLSLSFPASFIVLISFTCLWLASCVFSPCHFSGHLCFVPRSCVFWISRSCLALTLLSTLFVSPKSIFSYISSVFSSPIFLFCYFNSTFYHQTFLHLSALYSTFWVFELHKM